MSRWLVRRWYASIPPAERDAPLVPYKGRYLTPREVLEINERGGPEAEEVQRAVEHVIVAGLQTYHLEEVAKLRVLEDLKRLPPDFSVVAIAGGRTVVVPRDELIRMVEAGVGPGKHLVEAEKRRVARLLLTMRAALG